MHLLECTDGDEFVLTKNLTGDNEIPPYAILSHTWTDDDEVTFHDIKNRTGTSKKGYNKIRFCAQQAKRDGLRYFWVDTCCIDKSNQVALQDAINSMFRWYQNAKECYVYLSDVSTNKRKICEESSMHTWETAFRHSRWFSRGWTLQELLAPRLVTFFSCEGNKLGNKITLERQIYEVTGIAIRALQGTPLCEFSVEERFSWTSSRHTTYKEDKAYSLFGMFDICMPLLYGEGEEKAFRRLRAEISKLSYDTAQILEDRECIQYLRLTDPRDDKKRIEDTKGGLIKDSYRWILDHSDFQKWRSDEQSRLLWINGDPGKGKTMLLCGIIDELEKSKDKDNLLSFFFCQATDSRINNSIAVLRGLLYMLVDQQPSLISHIRRKQGHAGKTLFEDVNAWVALTEIFKNILQDPSINNIWLVIDALDECVHDLPRLLQFVTQQAISSRVKWIVSSRNWPDIQEQLERPTQKVKLSLELNADSVSAAVAIFIKNKVSQLAQRKKYDTRTQDTVQDHLTSNANDTFLWVALVCQILEETPKRNVLKKLNIIPPGLDSLYERMMQRIDDSDDAELCTQILASAVSFYRPATIHELAVLVEQLEGTADDLESVREIIGLCGSFLTLRKDIVYFVHQSAKDYLLEKTSEKLFPMGIAETHHKISSRSLKIMSRTLRRDIYGLGQVGFPVDRVQAPDPDPLLAVRYSCVYWVDHLCEWGSYSPMDHKVDLQDGGTVYEFVKLNFLYWLEALSLCRSIPKGVLAMTKLDKLIQRETDVPALTELVHDACRFIRYHKQGIEISPLQAYVSAMIFSPINSIIKHHFKMEEPNWITIMPAIGKNWSPCLATLEGHTSSVISVVFSHESARLVSGSSDGTVRIWDAGSGECLRTLKCHSNDVKDQHIAVRAAVFSYNSTRLASASGDGSIRIWDISSCECLMMFGGHTSAVLSVSFSHDSARLAAASFDGSIRIWDTSSGECLMMLEGHSKSVPSVVYSHNSTHLASGSYDNTVRIWDAGSGKCLMSLEGHNRGVETVVFSQNSARLASGSQDHTIRIWDVSSGDCLATLKGSASIVWSVVFSPDSTRLASGSHDCTVRIWDVSNGKCLSSLEGHTAAVFSVVFSHDSTHLASTSFDQTVRIWDTRSGEYLETHDAHNHLVESVVFSHDSSSLASGSRDGTVRIWDASSGKCLAILEGHTNTTGSLMFSHDSTRLATASYDHTVCIWDASSGERLAKLEDHSSFVRSVVYSHDSARLASASHDGTVRIWDAVSGECLMTLECSSNDVKGHNNHFWEVVFSHDSTRLASGSHDGTVRIWDTVSGECLMTPECHISDPEHYNNIVESMAFSHDSARLLSASRVGTVHIWDADSGDCEAILDIGRVKSRISFDRTGYFLHTGRGMIAIDAIPRPHIARGEIDHRNLQFQGVGLSSDQQWITCNSQKLLWLPYEYRPSNYTVSGRTIGFGVGSGKVWMCKLGISIFEHP